MNKIIPFIGVASVILLLSCGKKKEEADDKQMEMQEQVMNETYVDTMQLHAQEFNKQIVCNGKLNGKTKSDLNFLHPGVVATIHVRQGMYVKKGALIAELDKVEKTRQVEKAEHDLERSQVELTDKLIGLGYHADLQDVPEDVMKRMEVTTGYYSAKFSLQTAKRELEECNLYAPFSGRIADLLARPYQQVEKKVCTLVDDAQFEVEFQILEAELKNVSVGQKVKVSPFVQDSQTFMGAITEVNPMVDEKGLIKVTALIDRHNGKLIDGMNVRIVVEEKVQDMFVVPKDAVVERDGYHVVFRYEDGIAVWTYVDVLYSNIASYAISGCQRKETSIHEGDIIITSGNLNLADGTEVKINQE